MSYNPYHTNMMNSGWGNHPNSMNQPQNHESQQMPVDQYPKRQTSGYSSVSYGLPTSHQSEESYSNHSSEAYEHVIPQPREHYQIKGEVVYTEPTPLKSSTMQDYELYMMEKEYYSTNPTTKYSKKHTDEMKEMKPGYKITCENLPLATTYVRSQPYQNLNSPEETLCQGTFFADLYRPYVPRKVVKGGRR